MPSVRARDVESTLLECGFVIGRRTTHGVLYVHSDGRSTTIGQHYRRDVIPNGTLRAIERQVKIRF